MQVTGWICAIIAIGIAIALWRMLVREREHASELLYQKLDAENQLDALHAGHAASAEQDAGRDSRAAARLQAPLASAQANHAALRTQLEEYRTRVRRFDEAVQYCLQPVELIFGADPAAMDELVSHVEGARRKLFEARTAVEQHPLHASRDAPDPLASDLQAMAAQLAAPAGDPEAALAGEQTPADAASCLDAALLMVSPPAEIAVVRAGSAVPAVAVDESGLREALVQLIGNAAQAMPDGGTLTLTTRVRDDGDVEVVVADTGSGMPPDVAANVFDPYFSTRTGEGADGLGLTRTHAWVTALGGSIGVRSARGSGSTFTLVLPAAHGASDRHEEAHAQERLAGAH
jgi:signal transduction histidine kinase